MSLAPLCFNPSGESAGNADSVCLPAPGSLSTPPDSFWNADTGATAHMTPHRHWFMSYEPLRTPIRLADGKVIYSAGVGTVILEPVVSGIAQRAVEFTRVLHVPSLANNLLSVLYLVKYKAFRVLIERNTISFIRSDALLFTATINEHNTAYLDGVTRISSPPAVVAYRTTHDLALWHRRSMHLHHC